MLGSTVKKDIRTLSKEALIEVFEQWGEPKFRANQVFQWLWQKSLTDFNEMSNLSLALREKLIGEFEIRPITIDQSQHSADGTMKCTFKLFDGNIIEGVLIPTDTRVTACISSQVGCSLSCKFCATGYLERMRNLSPGEIYDQVVLLNAAAEKNYGQKLSNIVFMGMGEPLLNYANVLSAIDKITGEHGLNISAKRITVSTAGIAKMIKKLADDGVKFNLALSLHAANDTKRDTIMPINESNNLNALVDALNYFYQLTKNKITFEYLLLSGVNDSIDAAKELLELCKRVPAKVNIIEYNPIDNADFIKSGESQSERFINYLETHRVTAKVRRSRGKDIDAACGQLANKQQGEN